MCLHLIAKRRLQSCSYRWITHNLGILKLPGSLSSMTFAMVFHLLKEYEFLRARISKSTCDCISSRIFFFYHCILQFIFIKVMCVLLCVRCKPEGDVDVVLGQLLIFSVHLVVMIVSGIVMSVVHFFMCQISTCSR